MSLQLLSSEGESSDLQVFVANRPFQAVRFMLGSTALEVKASHHSDGTTSLDVHFRSTQAAVTPPPPVKMSTSKPGAAVTESSDDPTPTPPAGDATAGPPTELGATLAGHQEAGEAVNNIERQKQAQKRLPEWILVVAALFATITFQAGLNPPGGFWQDDLDPATSGNMSIAVVDSTTTNYSISFYPPLSYILSSNSNLSNFNVNVTLAKAGSSNNNVTGHGAGDPIFADKHRNGYMNFFRLNTLAFAYSLLIILALLSRPLSYHTAKNFAVISIPAIWMTYVYGAERSLKHFEYSFTWVCRGVGASFLAVALAVVFFDLFCVKRGRRRDNI